MPLFPASANPHGGEVSAGQASIHGSANKLDIIQHSDKAVIDWRGFDISKGEQTEFHQPSNNSLVLNRVNSKTASHIDGKLTANGKVLIINQNGILFGKNAQVDVNSLIASSADVDNAKFMQAGKLKLDKAGNPQAAIINQGQITAQEAGLVGFVAPNVLNSGVISAKLGKVHLASGDTATMDFYGDELLQVAVSDKVKSQLVDNRGIISANGGKVSLTAAGGKQIVDSLINVQGSLQAQSVGIKNGEIIIAAAGNKAKTSKVLVQASLDASGRKAGERGGKITVTGDNIALLDGTFIDASGDFGKSATTANKKISDYREGSAGGDIKIGGDYLGGGDTPTANNLYVGSKVLVLNDALTTGDAGRTIFWSDDKTEFYGNIYARALGGKAPDAQTWQASLGGNAGEGGFVETSGHGHLDAGGYVDLTASNGKRGTYFLDPANITIYGNTSSVFNNVGLVAHYALDDGVGASASDSSGNNNNGTLVNSPTWSASTAPTIFSNSGSLSFDGASRYVTLPSNINFAFGTGAFTVSVWYNPSTTSYTPILSLGGSNTNYGEIGNNRLGSLLFYYANGQQISSATAPSSNIWVFATLVGNGGVNGSRNIKLYQDGVQVGSTYTFDYNFPQQAFVIGANQSALTEAMNGKIDDVRIYNNALSLNDISELAGTRFTVAGLSSMSATADISLSASNNITLDFGGDNLNLTTAARSLTLTAGNQITTASTGSITTNNGAINLTGTNGISLNHNFTLNSGTAATTLTTTNSPITLNGATIFGGNATLNAGTSTITTASTITSGNNNLTLTADDVVLGGNISGTGTLTLKPSSSNRAISVNSGAGNFNLDSTEIGYLVDGWGSIVIGRNTGLTAGATLNVGSSDWYDPIIFYANNSITLNNNLNFYNNASLTTSAAGGSNSFNSANIITAGGAVLINGNLSSRSSSINTNSGSFSAAFQTFLNATGTGLSVTTAGGNINFCGSCAGTGNSLSGGAVGQNILLDAGLGSISFASPLNGAYHLSANAANITTGGNAWGDTTPLGNVSLVSVNGLTLPSISAANIFAQTTGAAADINMPIGNVLTVSGAGTPLTLAAGRNFINNSGVGAFSAPAGRWLVYSTNPASDVIGGLSNNFRRFTCVYGGACPALSTGNGLLYSYTPTLTATPNALAALTYGNVAPSLAGYLYTLSGYLGADAGADVVTGSLNGSTNYTQGANVGNYFLNYASGSLSSDLGYGFTYANNATALTVGTRALGVTAVAKTKTYGNVDPALTYSLSSGSLYGGDAFSGVLNRSVGETVAGGPYAILQNTLTAGANYSITYTGANLTINKADLNVTGLTASDKIYDTTTSATLGGGAIVTALGTDVVTLGGAAVGNFGNKNVGVTKAVTVTGVTLGGADAGNYNLIQQTGLTADITVADLNVTGLTASDKIYDTTTSATLGGGASVTALGADVVTLGGTAVGNFGNKNVGVAKAVTVTGVTLGGADAGNYNLIQQTGLTADIIAADLNVTGLTASNKTYDTTTIASLSGVANVAALGADVVSLSGVAIGAFLDPLIGSAKSVAVSGLNLVGADANNYNIIYPTLFADITVMPSDRSGGAPNPHVVNHPVVPPVIPPVNPPVSPKPPVKPVPKPVIKPTNQIPNTVVMVSQNTMLGSTTNNKIYFKNNEYRKLPPKQNLSTFGGLLNISPELANKIGLGINMWIN